MQGNSDVKRKLNVIGVNNIDNTISVKYGGAYSGYYDVEISYGDNDGRFDASGIVF